MTITAIHFLGIRLHAMTKQDLISAVAQAVKTQQQYIIGNHNLHSLYLWEYEPTIRKFYALADYIHIDGMPLVWLGRMFGHPLKPEHRTGYMELLPSLAEEAARQQWRIFYLGSRPGVAERAAEALRTQYPGLQIAARNGYFETLRYGEDNQSVLSEIRDYAPDILMVGMGMPRQEIWIQDNLEDLGANAIFCCGALMERVAGELPTAPQWLGPLGLEWVFRFCSDPVRTWRRYLIEPWFILFLLTKYHFRNAEPRRTA